jgi:membrane protease YdiL (CAAX protease family)
MDYRLVLLDYVYIAVFAAIYPVYGFFSYRRLLKLIAQGHEFELRKLYQQTMAGHWILLAFGVALWVSLERSWPDIGFTFEMDKGFWAGLAIALVTVAALLYQLRWVRACSGERKAELLETIKSLAPILPATRADLASFYRVSLTAGIVEEIIWRGMLIWYLQGFMSLWLAGLVSAIGFGLAHSYQGMAHIPKVTLLGCLFSVVYLVSGTIWLPIVLHALVDVLQGRCAYEMLGAGKLNAGTSKPI